MAELRPHPRNSRTHSAAQIDQIVASMREWGWTNPVLIGEDGTIIAGHGRVEAARRMAVETVPTITARGWTDEQIRAYMLADNQLAINAGWDEELLSLEMADLRDLGFEIDLIGFDEAALARLAGRSAGSGDADPDTVPEAPVRPVARRGEIWLLGQHRLRCGDATNAEDVAALLGTVKPTLMVTDPPYGVAYDPAWRSRAGVNKNRAKLGTVQNDDRADWRQARALFPGQVAYVWHGALHSGVVEESLRAAGFEIRSQIIWAKDRFALSRGHYHWQHEPCWYAVRGRGNWNGGRSQSTVWNIKSREDGGHGHGTQKPVECMKLPIENNSTPGQAVYEPFDGSGTTIIACEMTGRACFAMELLPAYVDVAIRRWQQFTGEAATRESDGAAFDELEPAEE